MVYKTILKSNQGKCPIWGVDVSILGWYKEANPETWDFANAECPIIENSKLPRYEQKQEYELMSCPDPSSCPLYTEFQPRITKDI